MCLQYGAARSPGEERLITGAGDITATHSADGVCDPDGGMHALWSDVLPEHVFAPPAPRLGPDYVAALDRRWRRHVADAPP